MNEPREKLTLKNFSSCFPNFESLLSFSGKSLDIAQNFYSVEECTDPAQKKNLKLKKFCDQNSTTMYLIIQRVKNIHLSTISS